MYSEKQQAEFYEIVEQRKNEIQALKISSDKKDDLYLLVEETIYRFEKNKITYLNKQIDLEHLEEEEKNSCKD